MGDQKDEVGTLRHAAFARSVSLCESGLLPIGSRSQRSASKLAAGSCLARSLFIFLDSSWTGPRMGGGKPLNSEVLNFLRAAQELVRADFHM